ncbi:TonB-dependent receptor [Massilia sp. H-1]|nr:TonB-dependent receptor [Massilia sp. H-1]
MILERREEDVVSGSTAALTRDRTTNSGALSYSLKRGAHLATASARLDDSSQYGSKSTGGIAYGYRLTRELRASASFGTSFRAPTFNELYYPGFGVASNRPEQGKNVEAGLTWASGTTEATAVYYRNRLTDLLVSTAVCPVEPATHAFGCAYNVNKATLAGLSVGARTHVADFTFQGGFDLQDPQDDTTGKQLVRRSKKHAKFSVEYSAGAFVAGA